MRFLESFFLFTVLLLVSCGKEEFATNQTKNTFTTAGEQTEEVFLCANSTLIKPPVDFLFLWDNSSSQAFISDETKEALRKTINNISPSFDYRILLAPLIPDASDSYLFLMTENANGLSAQAKNLIISNDNAEQRLEVFKTIPTAGGSKELGVERALDLIRNNISNGIFRKKSYTYIVVMSNGDDNKYIIDPDSMPSDVRRVELINNYYLPNLRSLRDDTLQSIQLRMFSMVAHNNCTLKGGIPAKIGATYKDLSKILYLDYANSLSGTDKGDQSDRLSTADSYDICTTEFDSLFDGINNSIFQQVIKHVYEFWPLAQIELENFDPQKISVFKNTGDELIENDPNGFKYVGHRTNQYTRLVPSKGEEYTGHMIQLFGTGKVTYPECLRVVTQEPADFYGYLVLSREPLESTIKVKINGKEIPQKTDALASGWQYTGFQKAFNIKVKSFSEPQSPGLPEDLKTGYFLKLHGDAIYSNGSTIEVLFKPKATK